MWHKQRAPNNAKLQPRSFTDFAFSSSIIEHHNLYFFLTTVVPCWKVPEVKVYLKNKNEGAFSKKLSFSLCAFVSTYQCDQNGLFLKSLGHKISSKVAQIFGNICGNFETHDFLIKSYRLLFGQFVKKLGYFLFQHLVTLIPIQIVSQSLRLFPL